jgi:eukaryotic-like serine/threonine-protein kinase
MNDERWHCIDALLGAALERRAEERAAFLQEACRDDVDLRRQVESLLSHHDAGDFLEQPAAALLNDGSPGPGSVAAHPGSLAGVRLGAYELIECIGSGGMGEVYRARDSRLDRDVAIKLMPARLAADPEWRARFEREARAISAFAHPHICTLFDVGAASAVEGQPPPLYLVMELLRGETLAERLRRGALPVDQVLDIGAQIADALDAAHRNGIIHRDLKPANVMLVDGEKGRPRTPSVKLLDFGLAKLTMPRTSGPDNSSPAPDGDPATAPLSRIGTLPYMAPEQLAGSGTDARTDLWGLGAILYEMLTGRRPFDGDSPVSVMGHILHTDPEPPASRQPATPPSLDRLVRKCLAKDPDDRWYTAHDLADELRWISQRSAPAASVSSPRWRRARVLVPVAVVMALVGTASTWLLWLPSAPRAAPAQVSLDVRPAEEINNGVSSILELTPAGSLTALRWTPDGQALVFVGRQQGVQQLYVRWLHSDAAVPIDGTVNAKVPVVSPDGEWVAFWADKAIRKVPLRGGPAVDVASGIFYPPVGLAWTPRGTLLVGGGGGPIREIGPGGAQTAVTSLADTETTHILPAFLPDGRTLLVTARRRNHSWGGEEIIAFDLTTGARRVLLQDAVDARYVATGHLVFLRRGVLYAVPFDPERLEVRGSEVPLIAPVAQALTGGLPHDKSGAGQFAVSSTGTLAWVPGVTPGQPERALVTVDHQGRVSPVPVPPGNYDPVLRVSPDARRVALSMTTLTEVGLWIYDIERAVLSPLLRDGEANHPMWWPDGRRLAFAWFKDGRGSLAALPTDHPATPTLLGLSASPSSITPDGQQLAVFGGPDITIVTVEGDETRIETLEETPAFEAWPVFSPDGRWLAYSSNDRPGAGESSQLYLRAYPGPGPRYRVSVSGGNSAAWHPNGKQLFYLGLPTRDNKRQMMVVDVELTTPPRVSTPRVLFEFDPRELYFGCIPIRCFDVSPDGQRFYVTKPVEVSSVSPVTHVNLFLNWLEEVRAKVPTGAH